MSHKLRRRHTVEHEQDTPTRPVKKQKRNPPDLKTRVLDRQFHMSLFGNSRFNASHLSVPSFLGGKSSKRDVSTRNDVQEFLAPPQDVDLDLELSFASTMSLNSPVRVSQPLTPESENPDHVPMDISPAPPRMLQPSTTQEAFHPKPSQSKPFVGRPRAATSAARLFGRDMSNGTESTPQLSVSKSGTGTSSSKRLQRAALPTEWLSTSRTQPHDENAYSQVSAV